jgi:hypothetical protein
MRVPGRPERDAAGTIAFASDGEEFRYSEVDDYVVETKGCAPLAETSLRDVRTWTSEIASALGP